MYEVLQAENNLPQLEHWTIITQIDDNYHEVESFSGVTQDFPLIYGFFVIEL